MDRIEGTDRGHCPDCDREVTVRAFVAPAPPAPSPPPAAAPHRVPLGPDATAAPGLLVTQVPAPPAPPPPPAPVAAGPFRTAGQPAAPRRGPRGLVIVNGRLGAQLALAIVLFGSVIVAAVASGVGLALVLAFGSILVWPLLGELHVFERGRVELTGTHLIARAGLGPPRCAVPREAITHLECVEDRPRGWGVDAITGAARTRVADAGSRRDAAAIAARLAAELGVPAYDDRATAPR
jgi:hypothetical protein